MLPPTKVHDKVLFKILYETALANESEFFNTIVESIAKNLGVKHVFIAEFLPEQYQARTKSLWTGKTISDNYQYSILNTPCEHVIREKEIKIYPENIQILFPRDLDLVKWEVQSYIGTPLSNSKGDVIGHMAIMDNKSINKQSVELIKSVIKVSKNRVEAELQRVINDKIIEQREEELRQSEFLFRSLFEESPIGIVIDVHPKNKLVQVNKKMSRMVKYSMEELANMTAADITHPEDLRNYVPSFKSIVSNKIMDSSFEKRYITKDGEVIWGGVSLSVVRNKDNSVKHRVVMIQDITEKKKALLDIKEKAQELDEKNKELQRYISSNMQLENFAYIASHDLREPLLTIMGLVEILTDSYAEQLDEEALSFLNFIDQCVKNMEVLINDLLQYSRVNTKKHTTTNCNMLTLLQNIIQRLQKTIKEQKANIQLIDIPQDCIANENRISQLFQNLITNAIKFRKINQTPSITISAIDLDDYWRFAVKDNGIGIAEEYHDKIFLLFKKLHSKYEYGGTGIGLATCKKIVEQHGGKIWLESTPGKGSIFYFTISKEDSNQSK